MIKFKLILIGLIGVLVVTTSYAQEFNLQSITPSSIMKKGQVEIKLFNNLYTQQAFYNSSSEKQEIGFRETYIFPVFN